MLKIPAQHNITHPPGQIVNPVNLEQPLTKAVEDFQGTTEEGLRGRVRNLEQELKNVRAHNLQLYLELEKYKAIVQKVTKFT